MRKLNISLSVYTDLEDQEVIDMLVDGLIDKAGSINLVSVNGKKFEVNDSVFEIGLRARESNLGARKTRREIGGLTSGKSSECNAVGGRGSDQEVQVDS